MLLNVTSDEFNTILGALRHYQQTGKAEPANRDEWLQSVVCPDDDSQSLSSDEIDRLIERVNVKGGDPVVVDALNFYANADNWKEQETGIGMMPSDAEMDSGNKARAAIGK